MEKGPSAAIENETHLPLVQSVQRLITTRLDKLSSSAREALEVAAVYDSDFKPDTISEISGEPHKIVASALSELEKRLLVEVIDAAPPTLSYRFTHEKIKETILQSTSPARLRWLHHATAQAIEAHHPTPDQAAILAQHYELSGELSSAFGYWIQAGQRARQLFSILSAQEIFAHAESLIAQAPELSDEQIRELFGEWTDIAHMVEEVNTIQRINEDLIKLGQDRNSPLLIGAALDGLSDACLATNQYDNGLNYTNQAIQYLEQTENIPARMQAQLKRGTFLYMLNRLEESIESFEHALSVGSDTPDLQVSATRANAHYQIAVARILGGWPETAQIHAQRSLADFTALNRSFGQITAYSALAISLYFIGNYAQARLNCQLGIELASRSSAWRMLGNLHASLAMIELASGNIDEAVLHAKHANELGERYQHHEIISLGHRIIGDLYFWLKDPPACVECYQLASEASRDQFLWIDSHYRLGIALFLCGQRDSGRALIEESITFSESRGLGIELIQSWLSQMYTYLALQEWEPLNHISWQIYQEALKRSIPTARLVATHRLGELALRAGDITTATEYFRGTARVAASLPHPWLEIESLTLLHNALCQLERPESSIRNRIETLLDQMEGTIHEQPFIQVFCEYRQKVIRSLT
jgi:tetratricopeptide (TPR) repeat protein